MHRRIFAWFGASILLAVAAVSGLWRMSDRHAPWRDDLARAQDFIAHRFGELWTDPSARDAFAHALAQDLEVGVTVLDPGGAVLARAGGDCADEDEQMRVAVRRRAAPADPLGAVLMCREHSEHGGWLVLASLFLGAMCLWLGAGLIARRLVRPLGELVRVARNIGAGRLDSRMRVRHPMSDEIGVLGAAINDMATRIEKQVADQRALLAAVSHEIRTPLGHMRLLVDLARERPDAAAGHLDDIEREVLEVDALVGQLLASSRLEFDAIERRDLDAGALAAESLTRSGLDPELLTLELDHRELAGDPTLLARALANLLENARSHGGGVTALRVWADPGAPGQDEPGDQVCFEVHDRGPGFTGDEPDRAFDSFYRGKPGSGHGALGLGLALVKRIALAHGGRTWADNRAGGGARVGFSVHRRAPADLD
ncbi:HAMP domain-containing sensor histidine kinase [Haliangium sp.]|uniref:HAMP domain-containing sensor histidine kinase n=1 Tax=Haliangium sp. TaxID=2663208 RepID=UPI003D0B0D5D